jgi:hypothetical protein
MEEREEQKSRQERKNRTEIPPTNKNPKKIKTKKKKTLSVYSLLLGDYLSSPE